MAINLETILSAKNGNDSLDKMLWSGLSGASQLRFTQDVQAAQTFAVNVVADHYLVLMDDGEYQLIHESDMELLKDDSSEVAPTQEPPEAALRIVQCALKTRAAVDQGMAALERIRKEPR